MNSGEPAGSGEPGEAVMTPLRDEELDAFPGVSDLLHGLCAITAPDGPLSKAFYDASCTTVTTLCATIAHDRAVLAQANEANAVAANCLEWEQERAEKAEAALAVVTEALTCVQADIMLDGHLQEIIETALADPQAAATALLARLEKAEGERDAALATKFMWRDDCLEADKRALAAEAQVAHWRESASNPQAYALRMIAERDEAVAQVRDLKEQVARLEKTRPTAAQLAPLYLENPVFVAKLCDELLGRSGALLGEVREAAAAPARRGMGDGNS